MTILDSGSGEFPFVIFKIKSNLYCVDSRYIETLLQLPEFVELPDSPAAVKGIFPYRGEYITAFDLRTAFGLEDLSEEFNDFSAMLDKRKQEHIHWVNELERSIQSGERFNLSHDPHACAFGRWFDGFKSNNNIINAHLKKIDPPHQELHHAAIEAEEYRNNADEKERTEHLQAILRHVKEDLEPAIIRLLDDAKGIFHSTLYREMVMVLNQTRVGLVVDEVLSVDYLLPARDGDELSSDHKSPYVTGIRRNGKTGDAILELNIPQVMSNFQ